MAFNIFFFASSLDSATGALKSFEVELMLSFEACVGLVEDIVPVLFQPYRTIPPARCIP